MEMLQVAVVVLDVAVVVEHGSLFFFLPRCLQCFGGLVGLGGVLVVEAVLDGQGGGVNGKGPLHESLYGTERS